MARGFEIECPALCDTALTGLYLTGRKEIAGHQWRCEIRHDGVRMFKDDKPVAWESTNAPARRFAHTFVNWWKASRHLVTDEPAPQESECLMPFSGSMEPKS